MRGFLLVPNRVVHLTKSADRQKAKSGFCTSGPAGQRLHRCITSTTVLHQYYTSNSAGLCHCHYLPVRVFLCIGGQGRSPCTVQHQYLCSTSVVLQYKQYAPVQPLACWPTGAKSGFCFLPVCTFCEMHQSISMVVLIYHNLHSHLDSCTLPPECMVCTHPGVNKSDFD